MYFKLGMMNPETGGRNVKLPIQFNCRFNSCYFMVDELSLFLVALLYSLIRTCPCVCSCISFKKEFVGKLLYSYKNSSVRPYLHISATFRENRDFLGQIKKEVSFFSVHIFPIYVYMPGKLQKK